MSETIMRLAARGEGVSDAGTYYPLTAPGDLIAADGAIVPGPHRREPPCRHFPACGGCQLQHVDDDAYEVYLRDRIAAALAAQHIDAAHIRPPLLSAPRTRRRAALHAERRGGDVRIGFREEKSHRIVDMRECYILTPELFALIAPLRALLRDLLGPRGNAEVRVTLADQGVDLLLEGVTAESLAASERLAGFAQAQGLARLALDDGYGPQTVWEPQPVTVTLSGIAVGLPHAAFLQATRGGEAALIASATEAVGDAQTVADLFSGLGTFALSLGGRVYAAEAARDAALSLKAAANAAGRQLFVDHRDLYRRPLTTAEANRLDAIMLDPPRAGAKEQAVQLAASTVPRIAYISCNPATFARDAATLVEGGYRLDWIQPVGQFLWATHVELVGAFAR